MKTISRCLLLSFSCVLPLFASPAIPAATNEPAIGERPVLDDRYPERKTTFPGGVVGFTDLTYSSLAGYRPLILDLYRPADVSKPHPLVLYLHGGGWQSGHTRHSGAFENWPGALASIAARGYVVASIEYRLSGEAPFPAAIQDVKTAIRWLRAHAAQHGIDKTRAVIWGGSAGGQLAALAGTSCGVTNLEPPGTSAAQRPEPGAAAAAPAQAPVDSAAQESDCVQGVIAWYGIFDFATLATQSGPQSNVNDPAAAPARYLGCALAKCSPEVLARASAITYIDAKDPPMLLIHGINDHTVPIAQSREFLAALRAKGVHADLIELPGVEHSFVGQTADATRKASLEAWNKSLEFIEKTVGRGT